MSRAWRGLAVALVLVTTTSITGSAVTGTALAADPPGRPPSAAELRDQATQQAAALADEQVQQAIADAQATAALETYQLAQRRADEAARLAQAEAARLLAAVQATEAARVQLARYVASMYRSGMGDTRLSLITALAASENPQKLFSGLGLAQRVGTNQNDAITGFAIAQQAQAEAADRATAADAAEQALTAKAAEAKQSADTAVAAAGARVAAATQALASTEQAVVVAAAREAQAAALAAQAAALAAQAEALAAQAEAIARQRATVPAAAIDGAYTPRPLAGCTGGDISGFPNGRLPTAALCSLWGTGGQMLRADAASAFNTMSQAYAKQFGSPMCVTDSYRDYPSQVAVAAAKPTLAAFPGTSNHGWGVALDLCDGVQNFGSAQHVWMQRNAMAFGWFHPGWAQAGGSMPEAWHWEFAG